MHFEGMKYHIAAVAHLTNLSAEVIRSWERRYGLVTPQRDAAGVRLYSESDAARLALARAATQLGHPIRHVAKMTNEQLEALCKQDKPEQTPYAQVVERVISALREHDPTLAEQILSSSALLVPTRSLILDILAPILRAVGDEWERGRISVWQEHLLSTLIRNTVAALPRAPQNGDAMLFATPPFELHGFGITLAAILASSHGWRSANLGTAVPAEELVHAARRLKPKIVVVGMLLRSVSKASALEYVRTLERELPPKVDVWLGGTLGAQIAKRTDSPRIRAVPTLEEFERLSASMLRKDRV